MTTPVQCYQTVNQLLHQQDTPFQGNMPIHLRISLLESCNLRCYMCHLTALPDEKIDEIGSELMTLDLFSQLARDAFPYANRVTIGFAGEPTLHPQFAEFLKIIRSYKIESEVYTNGTTLHQESVAEAIALYADWLVVSLDGAEEETFARIRGGANLRSVENSIAAIRDRARQLNRPTPLKLGAHCTLMRSNVAQLQAIVEKAHRLEMDRVSSSHIGIFDGNLKEESLFLYKDEANRNLQCATDRAAELGISIDFPPQFGPTDTPQSEPQSFANYRCFQTNYSLIVLSNGDVLPCCHAAARWRLVMGNLHQSRLPDIWYGHRYDLLRESIACGDLPPACRDCAGNNPFMDVTTEWDLESYSPRASHHKASMNYLQAINQFEQYNYQEQQKRLQSALQEEKQIDHRFETISALEKKVKKKFHLTAIFQEQRPANVDTIGYVAPPPPSNSTRRRLNRALYESGEEFQGNLPLQVEMSIVAGCNIQCIMCTLSHLPQKEQHELLQRRIHRTTYQRIADQLFPYAESIFFGFGGEPTIHSDFPEFIRIASEAGLKIHVSSNGMAFTNDAIAQVCVDHLYHLIISMDGSQKETFERIRKGAKWERVIAGIQNLVARRKQTPHSRLRLSINYTLMKDTIDEFPGMVDLAHELGVDKLMTEHIIVTLPELEEQSLFSMREHSDRRVREALERAQRLGLAMEVPDLFNMESAPQDIQPGVIRNIRPKFGKKDVPYCHVLKYSVVITPDGQVLPCSNPDAQTQFRMGSLKESTFPEIWFGSKYQTLREGTNGTIPTLCTNCSMSGRSDGEIPIHTPQGVAQIHSDHRTLYPQQFVPRHLHLIERILEQNNRLQAHIDGLRDLDSRMAQHENNLRQIVATKSKRPPLAASLTWINRPPQILSGNAHFTFSVRVCNTGRDLWPDGNSEADGSVMIGGTLYQDNRQVGFMEGWGALPHPLSYNQEVEVTILTNTESLKPGAYQLKVDAVKLGKGFFEEFGSSPLLQNVEVTLLDDSEALWQRAIPLCTNLWSLTQGIRQGRLGKYPLFITASDKARITDKEGRQFLDYIMGWGTATLGYNHPAIQEAVASYLPVGPTLPLPHPLQVEVAEKLCTFLPCAERVLFGKNGSDPLEAAVRVARAYTQKDHILCCGYHGFHDWYVASIDSVAGIARTDRSLVHAFPYGDLDALRALLDSYHNDIAAIVMEPASMAYPPQDYLQTLRAWTTERGILLIFDEIMSAFRLANGGAQELYQVQPDLVTVGKGIANGLPLAALAGKRSLMDTTFRIGYGPTFHGEVYALAAASAALDIYAREPVCQRINALGDTLRQGIEKSTTRYGIKMHLSGIAPRQVFEFQAMEDYSPAVLRTFFLQELLEAGILCGGTLLPSYAHTDQDIDYTLQTIEEILKRLHHFIQNHTLDNEIRIPLHVLYLGEK